MVRTSGMSRGCKTCRTRRIKCDEKTPRCGQCVKSNRTCPGAVVDFILLQATDTDPRRSRRVESKVPPNPKPETRCVLRSKLCDVNVEYIRVAIPKFGQLTPEIFEQQLRQHFVYFFFKGRPDTSKPGQCLVPAMISDSLDSTMRDSLTAAALLFHANRSEHPSVLLSQAALAYGTGIKWQRRRLHDQTSGKKPSIQDMLVILMMGYYELLREVDGDACAFFPHVKGSVALLNMAGADTCSELVWQAVFKGIRTHMVYYGIENETPSIFASEEWLTKPWRVIPKNAWDLVIDVLTLLPQNLSASRYPVDSDSQKAGLMTTMQTLRDIWPAVIDYVPALTSCTLRNGLIPDTSSVSSDWHFVPNFNGCDHTLEALCVAYYSTAWIVLYKRMQEIDPSLELYDELILAHSMTILATAQQVEDFIDGCGYIKLMYPLRIIIKKSPSEAQQISAYAWLEHWKEHRGVKGLMNAALSEEFKPASISSTTSDRASPPSVYLHLEAAEHETNDHELQPSTSTFTHVF